jgi:hypothetical protein
VVSAAELRTAFQQTGADDTYDESYAIGVACGLRAAALERYPDDPEQRANWLSAFAERGTVVVDLDGIWHSADGRAARVVSFGEYE